MVRALEHEHYELLEPLGEGGFGRVFEARDRRSGERVALKELVHSTPRALASFKRELRALHDLSHPNLVEMRELFEHDGRWLIAMELVSGVDLLGWVRSGRSAPDFDIARLRSAIAQLAQALTALHRVGLVHRDLKPSNVRVTSQGRVVLLDFGLVTSVEDARSTQTAHGTVAYMAPEQATGDRIDAAADWYALGVILYEVLTGRLPFEGPATAVMMAKQGQPPTPPTDLVPSVPRDLNDLCMHLLARDPAERPTGLAVTHVVADWLPGKARADFAPSIDVGFAGRAEELEQLREALQRSREGVASVVLVEGASGVGKSALIDQFLRKLSLSEPGAVVLRGRCHERETLPYKAFDGVVDALADWLRSHERAFPLIPRRIGPLRRMFPVLGMVPTIAEAPSWPGHDSAADRRNAFEALAELLGGIADRTPLVVVVDDLQWADEESFRLIDALMQYRFPPAMMLALVCRPQTELPGPLHARLAALRALPGLRSIMLTGLSPAHARELTIELLGGDAAPSRVNRIVAESAGHPLFIAELAQHAASGRTPLATLSLDEALGLRLEELTPLERQVMEVAAIAGTPQPPEVFEAVLERDPPTVREVITRLRQARLLRSGAEGKVLCFHDRTRASVNERMAAERERRWHAQLAVHLPRRSYPDRAEIGEHWLAAGELDRAIDEFHAAADHALETLAFERAVELYTRCHDLGAQRRTPAWRRQLLVELGHALARAGRSSDAAQRYLEALAYAEGEARLQLRILAAQHLLMGAHVDAGLAAARELLDELGVPLPSGLTSALLTVGWNQSILRLRGLSPARPRELSEREAQRLEALSALLQPITWSDVLGGAALNARYVRLALASGDRRHAARALTLRAGLQGTKVKRDRAESERLLSASRALDTGTDDPEVVLWQALAAGQSAGVQYDRAALTLLQDAERMALERCPDAHWMRTLIRVALTANWYNFMHHDQLAELGARWILEARDRGDRFASTALMTLGSCYGMYLRSDDPEGCAAALTESMQPWPAAPFGLAHLGALIGQYSAALYRGPSEATAYLQSREREIANALLFRVPFAAHALTSLRCSAALSAAVHESFRTKHALEIRRHARALRVTGEPLWVGLSALAEAHVALLEGSASDAARTAARAVEILEPLQVQQGAAANYFLGLLEGGEAGRQRRERALAPFTRQGWRKPERWLRGMAPGCILLE